MNTPLRRLASVVLVMFLALLGSVTAVQYVQAGSLNNDPRNVRTIYREFGNARGSIVVAGEAVASSTPVDDAFGYQRVYADGPLWSAVTGFYSIANGAGWGLEDTQDDVLTGRSDRLFFSRLRDVLTGQRPEGATVETTLLPAAQQAARDALGQQQGAVVAIEPATGRILALVSTPGYDPNTLAVHDTAAASQAFDELVAAPGNPLRSKATQENYPPGSTFKLVTAAAALEDGRWTPESELPAPTELELPLSSSTLGNFGGGGCGADPISLADALRVSCNTAFAGLGIELGAEALEEQAQRFGFDADPPAILPNAAGSTFPDDLDGAQTALAAIGQGSVTASPLQMALVAAAIANDGVLMEPTLVDTVRAADLSVVSRTEPSVRSEAVSGTTAESLTRMMVGVVEGGSGTSAQIGGVQVAGKTGTAQTTAEAAPHAWFTGFAPTDDPRVAVAVFVQNGGDLGSEATGGRVAAPIARAVMQAVLGS
ncbi:peptidoglycan D,D-transpeptidase FtsI family protein [Cellulomonas marina]|uniref:Peptidoglycan glycosyltransferase n=1 Tax=Cellulomonas marina TaxID=988821 RepID=A0A1I1AC86_9CELL|nr:penicillin-binding protein 2 [Cellulomonas marina]GIG30382.1 cell division protein FtsI [Cellulomonas marina]SFB34986.1 peptidoglycan glycosyltransferase [Cellulomonas marina]